MKAIKVKYIGPTDYKGSRLKATDEDGNSVTISYPHEAHQGTDAHALAAIELCKKMNWLPSNPPREWQHTHLIGGGLKDCYVFVFALRPENRADAYVLPFAEKDGGN